MTPYYSDEWVTLYHGDCREVLPTLDPVETCITDPPYGLGFMGKKWDQPGALVEREADRSNVWDKVGGNHNPSNAADRARTRLSENAKYQAWATEVFGMVADAMLPGASLLAFGGTRTFHRLTCAIEDAGFEIRDCLMWLYGSGFPKSHNLGGEFEGWGTALKPAWEPIILAMRPLAGTFAANALEHGVAGLNVDGARIGTGHDNGCGRDGEPSAERRYTERGGTNIAAKPGPRGGDPAGRWPANLALDSEAARMLDEQSGTLSSPGTYRRNVPQGLGDGVKYGKAAARDVQVGHGDSGGASRFFYTSKASKADRGEGNNHPTVKPSDLMKWLCTLTATPTGGTVLDPFSGSGTTILAAKEGGRKSIGIELEERYCEMAARRCSQEVLAL
jgi:site-specific DNA-methyltransferase (adenine-specific)